MLIDIPTKFERGSEFRSRLLPFLVNCHSVSIQIIPCAIVILMFWLYFGVQYRYYF